MLNEAPYCNPTLSLSPPSVVLASHNEAFSLLIMAMAVLCGNPSPTVTSFGKSKGKLITDDPSTSLAIFWGLQHV